MVDVFLILVEVLANSHLLAGMCRQPYKLLLDQLDCAPLWGSVEWFLNCPQPSQQFWECYGQPEKCWVRQEHNVLNAGMRDHSERYVDPALKSYTIWNIYFGICQTLLLPLCLCKSR